VSTGLITMVAVWVSVASPSLKTIVNVYDPCVPACGVPERVAPDRPTPVGSLEPDCSDHV